MHTMRGDDDYKWLSHEALAQPMRLLLGPEANSVGQCRSIG
jgi:hypothetical protein